MVNLIVDVDVVVGNHDAPASPAATTAAASRRGSSPPDGRRDGASPTSLMPGTTAAKRP